MLSTKIRPKIFPGSTYSTLVVIVLTGIVALYIYEIRDYKETPYDVAIIDQKFYSELPDSSWHRVNLGAFSIDTPKSYKFVKRRGIDSYVGELCTLTDTLSFGYGWYSYDYSEYRNNKDYAVEHLFIDGRKSVLIFPKAQDGIMGIYIQNITELDNLEVGSSTIKNFDIKLKILKSIKINISL